MKVTGVAGRLLEVWGPNDRVEVRTLCEKSGFSPNQCRTALARLRRLGIAEHVATDAWRRMEVDPVPWFPKVGDRVRCAKSPVHRQIHLGAEGTIDKVADDWTSVRVDFDGYSFPNTTFCWMEEVEPAPPAPRPSGYVVQRKPDVPWEFKTPLQQRGVAP